MNDGFKTAINPNFYALKVVLKLNQISETASITANQDEKQRRTTDLTLGISGNQPPQSMSINQPQ